MSARLWGEEKAAVPLQSEPEKKKRSIIVNNLGNRRVGESVLREGLNMYAPEIKTLAKNLSSLRRRGVRSQRLYSRSIVSLRADY